MKRFLFLLSFLAAALGSAMAQTVAIPWRNISLTPTTLSGYGITDAQPLDSDLTSIAALSTTTFGRSLLAFASANSSVLYTDGSGNWVLGTTLPAVSGANLTALNASQLTTGTLPAARLPAFTGDVTTSAGSAATTLATVNSNVGTFGSATQSLTLALDAKGRITSAAAQAITPAWSAITSKPTTLSGYGITDAYTSPTVDQMVSARVVRDALYSDGATSNRAVVWTPGIRGAVAGQSITIPFEFDVPTSNPSTASRIAAFVPTATTAVFAAANSLEVLLYTSGGLLIRQLGTTTSDYRQFEWTGFRAAYSGAKGLRGAVVFTGNSTSTPTVFVQGADISANFTAATGGTPPNWIPSGLDTTVFLVGFNWPSGRLVPHAPRLGAWTASEAAEWSSTGRVPVWDETNAGNAAKLSSDFATSTGWVLTGATTISAGKLNLSASDSAYMSGSPIFAGTKYTFTVNVDSVTAGSVNYYNGASYISFATAPGTYTISFTAAATYLSGAALQSQGGNAVCDNYTLRVLGPLFRPVVQPIAIVADATTNGIAGVLTGMTPLTTRRDWVIQANTSTNGNQQLLGASPFFDYTRNVIDDWVVNNKGGSSRTISLGSASGGSQYLSGGTAAGGRNVPTLATRVIGSSTLWVNSNGTDSLQHTIRGHLVD
ncbi:hypothetical protein K0B96_06655 [Horticoccus luteus]|uniref:Uncharacterized protein n=1 Tax=Horticoccus luteus TaxID=2862869 RepID=A0A8F9XID6_9BACT|nr:hypothetical protein [Horticoccus luteus]QYM80290.1 hypothetical protein K0B96_06655 [Horticoccus luteus]